MEYDEVVELQGSQSVRLSLKDVPEKKTWNVEAAPFEPNYKKNE